MRFLVSPANARVTRLARVHPDGWNLPLRLTSLGSVLPTVRFRRLKLLPPAFTHFHEPCTLSLGGDFSKMSIYQCLAPSPFYSNFASACACAKSWAVFSSCADNSALLLNVEFLIAWSSTAPLAKPSSSCFF